MSYGDIMVALIYAMQMMICVLFALPYKRSKKHILNVSGITKTREQHEYLYVYLTRKDNIRR